MSSPLSLTCTRRPAGLVVMRWSGCCVNPGARLALIGISLQRCRISASGDSQSWVLHRPGTDHRPSTLDSRLALLEIDVAGRLPTGPAAQRPASGVRMLRASSRGVDYVGGRRAVTSDVTYRMSLLVVKIYCL